MKIILCIFLLNITAVSVFGQSVELNDIVGQSVKFPAAVKKVGSLMHSSATIGDVTSGSFTALPNEKFSGRLQWDSSTGLFSLSGLKLEDSGEYKVQNTEYQNINVFQLNVYVPVSKPHVSITQNEYPCTIECTAESGTGVTLSWYREGEKKSFVFSRVGSAPGLYLPAPVKRSGTYTCEAKNSVSNEKASITVGAHCTVPTSSSTWIIVAYVIAAVAVLTAVVFALKCHRNRKEIRGVRTLIQGVRTLIQVKELLNNVDLHASGETRLELSPNSVRSLIQVKKRLVYLDPRSYSVRKLIQDERVLADGVRKLIRAVAASNDVKELLDDLDLREHGETRLELSPDAVRTLIQVKELLNNVDLHTSVKELLNNVDLHASGDAVQAVPQSGFIRRRRDGRTLIQVKELLDTVDLHASVKDLLNNVDLQDSGETRVELSSDVARSLIQAARSLIQVKELLDDVDPSKYGDAVQAVPQSGNRKEIRGFIRRCPRFLIRCLRPEEMVNLTSSHQTEVPLNQATCEVGEP